MPLTARLNPLREELIASLIQIFLCSHYFEARTSNPQFAQQLVEICFPVRNTQNDPRMEAAYYLRNVPLLAPPITGKIEELLALPDDGETMNGNIFISLPASAG